jgi:hypothetical protein
MTNFQFARGRAWRVSVGQQRRGLLSDDGRRSNCSKPLVLDFHRDAE